MLPVINLGPLSMPTSPLILLVGFWLGITLAEKKANLLGCKPESVEKILWWGLLSGLIGARLSFIARNPSAFKGQLISIFSMNPELLDPAGGFVVSLAVSYFLITKYDYSLLQILDGLVPFFIIIIPAVHLSQFASGSGYGSFTDLPWGIDLWGGSRHPVQIYYALSSLAVLIYILYKVIPDQRAPGKTFLFLVILTSGYITIFGAFQAPILSFAGFRFNQLLSWLLFSLSLLSYQEFFQIPYEEHAEI